MRDKVLETVDDMKDEIVNLTCRLIEFPTTRLSGGAPFWECSNFISEKLKEAGFDTELIPVSKEKIDRLAAEDSHYRALGLKGPIAPRVNVFGKKKGSVGKPSLHINGHYTYVEPGPGWSTDPFKGVVKNNRIYGRGACDAKGGIASMIMAATALERAEVKLKGNLFTSATVDTHLCGDLGAGYIVEKGYGKADMVIITDAEKYSRFDRIVIGYRGELWLEITTFGQKAHGSTPYYGVNASEKMVKIITALQELRQKFAGITSQYPILPPESRHPTIVIASTIHGGVYVNLVPGKCTIGIDRRLIPEESPESARKEIEEVIESLKKEDKDLKAELRTIFETPPAVTPANDKLPQTIMKNIREVTGKEPEAFVHPGFLDFRWFAKGWNVPVVTYGPGDGGDVTAGFSKDFYTLPDEHVVIPDLVSYTKVLALSIMDLLGVQ